MNERIRQLAEQAGITTNLDTDYYEKDMNKWVDYFSEKFAELIVRECGRVYIQNQQDGVMTLTQDLLQHFGVEE